LYIITAKTLETMNVFRIAIEQCVRRFLGEFLAQQFFGSTKKT
jgi:hypothetical protein